MIFILLGIVLLALKLGEVEPVTDWEWVTIAVPFLLAFCWFEIFESHFGFDVRRERNKRKKFEASVQYFKNKKPRI